MEERIRELKAQLVSNMANRKQLLKGRHNRDLQGTERAQFVELVSQAEALRAQLSTVEAEVRRNADIRFYVRRGYSRAEAESAARNDDLEAAASSGRMYYGRVRIA